jgi:hypothetical protein
MFYFKKLYKFENKSTLKSFDFTPITPTLYLNQYFLLFGDIYTFKKINGVKFVRLFSLNYLLIRLK